MCLVGNYQDNMLLAALRTSLDNASGFFFCASTSEFNQCPRIPCREEPASLKSEWIPYYVLNEVNAPLIVVRPASVSPLLCHNYQVYCPFPEGRWSTKLYLLAFVRHVCCEYLGTTKQGEPATEVLLSTHGGRLDRCVLRSCPSGLDLRKLRERHLPLASLT